MPLQATSGAASYDAFGGGVPAVPNYIEDVFSTYLYTGTGADQTITNGIDLSTKGGLVWTKSRAGTYTFSNRLVDTVRGSNNGLRSNGTFANQVLTNAVTGFTSTGYTLGPDSTEGNVNYSSDITYVSWTFRKQPKFFDVVTWTGDGSASRRAISHALGSVPGCIITKRTDSTGTWWTYHRANPVGPEYSFELNTNGTGTNGVGLCDIPPTSTVFYVNSVGGTQYVNINGATYVAYVFAHNAGGFGLTGTYNVISCGSFTTDGSGNATIDLGYEPQWVLMKSSSSDSSNWILADTMRGWTVDGAGGNSNRQLYANTSDAEAGGTPANLNATGFTFKSSYSGYFSTTFIYIAIRRGPMKVPTSGTSVFSPQIYTGTNTTRTLTTSGFPIDLVITDPRSGAFGIGYFDRLRGATKYLNSAGTGAEGTGADSLTSFASMDGYTAGADNDTAVINYTPNYVNWLFRRAPSFFDEVCYTGTGSATTFSHNLGAVPEMMIGKSRSGTFDWCVYHKDIGNTKAIYLNGSGTPVTSLDFWNNTTPTSSVFTIGTINRLNTSGNTQVMYLFATCAGVSKVGSYTGTATTLQIDCGFTGGARFVLIKRTDSTGDWYVWDSARGIVAGNDSYLLLNSAAAEVTNTDYIDTYSAGFEISSTAPAAINASGGSFIFFAVA